jgi:hypothetical protein
MPGTKYEASGVHIAGVVKAARELGVLEAALARVSPEAREVLNAPHRQRWAPGSVLQELRVAIVETSSPEMLANVNYLLARDSMGPIVMPLLKVAMALTGRTPASVFSRLGEIEKTAMRGVEVEWTTSGDKSGVMIIRYPDKLPTIVHHAWEGVFRFGFELAGARGHVARYAYIEGGKAIRFELQWL